MYMMGLGGRPIGECYLSPPGLNEATGANEAWLIGHYYSGGNIRLIGFKEPLEAPQAGSSEARMREMEEWKYYMLPYVETFLSDLCDATGVTFKTLEEFKGTMAPPPEIVETPPNASYLVQNIESYGSGRSW